MVVTKANHRDFGDGGLGLTEAGRFCPAHGAAGHGPDAIAYSIAARFLRRCPQKKSPVIQPYALSVAAGSHARPFNYIRQQVEPSCCFTQLIRRRSRRPVLAVAGDTIDRERRSFDDRIYSPDRFSEASCGQIYRRRRLPSASQQVVPCRLPYLELELLRFCRDVMNGEVHCLRFRSLRNHCETCESELLGTQPPGP